MSTANNSQPSQSPPAGGALHNNWGSVSSNNVGPGHSGIESELSSVNYGQPPPSHTAQQQQQQQLHGNGNVFPPGLNAAAQQAMQPPRRGAAMGMIIAQSIKRNVSAEHVS